MLQSRNDNLLDPTLNAARRTLYRFAALALADPRTGSWHSLSDRASQRLVAAAARLVRDEPEAAAASLAKGEVPLPALDPADVFDRLPHSPAGLNSAYEQTFGLLVSSACPPYETEYIDGKLAFRRSGELADIAGFYRAFGLEPAASHPERHDHVVLELEFMAALLSLEHRALEDPLDGGQRASLCRQAQAKFLKEHLSWWVPAFARLLAHEDPGGFYAAVGAFLGALIPAERGLLAVPPPGVPISLSTLPPPEECEGCLATRD
jgi:DMSO reductase family type II enzyme chaperone